MVSENETEVYNALRCFNLIEVMQFIIFKQNINTVGIPKLQF